MLSPWQTTSSPTILLKRASQKLLELRRRKIPYQFLAGDSQSIRDPKHQLQEAIESPAALSRGFDGTAELCRHVQGFHLDYPRDYDGLGRIREVHSATCGEPRVAAGDACRSFVSTFTGCPPTLGITSDSAQLEIQRRNQPHWHRFSGSQWKTLERRLLGQDDALRGRGVTL